MSKLKTHLDLGGFVEVVCFEVWREL